MTGDTISRLEEAIHGANEAHGNTSRDGKGMMKAWIEKELLPALDKEGLVVANRDQVQAITRHDFFTAAALISMGGVDVDGNVDTMKSDVEYCRNMADNFIKER